MSTPNSIHVNNTIYFVHPAALQNMEDGLCMDAEVAVSLPSSPPSVCVRLFMDTMYVITV